MKSLFAALSLEEKCAVVFATVFALLGAALLWIQYNQIDSIYQDQSDRYGQSLAKQLAVQARMDTLAGNGIGLKAILTDLLDNTMIYRAAIYGLDNRPLAEAARETRPRHDLPSYTSAIDSGEQAIGYAFISLDDQSAREYRQRLLTNQAIGLFAMTLLAYFIARLIGSRISAMIVALRESLQQKTSPPVYRSMDEFGQLLQVLFTRQQKQMQRQKACEQPEPAEPHALMLVGIEHWDQLLRQVDHRLCEQFLFSLQQTVAAICKLYGGESRLVSGGFQVCFFAEDESSDYPFRAVCAAALMRELHREINRERQQQGKLTFNLNWGLSLLDKQQGNQTQLLGSSMQLAVAANAATLASRAGPDQIVCSEPLARHPSLKLRVDFEMTASGFRIKQLRDAYADLIKQQLQQLRQRQTATEADN